MKEDSLAVFKVWQDEEYQDRETGLEGLTSGVCLCVSEASHSGESNGCRGVYVETMEGLTLNTTMLLFYKLSMRGNLTKDTASRDYYR